MNDKAKNDTAKNDNAPLSMDRLKGYLSRIRDELVLKNHLAGMDVKLAVDGVAKEIDKLSLKVARDFGDAAGALGGEARLQGHLALMDVKGRMGLLEDVLRKGLHGAANSSNFLAETARLQLALGKMDAEKALEENLKELRRDSQKLKAESAAVLKHLELQLERLTAEAA